MFFKDVTEASDALRAMNEQEFSAYHAVAYIERGMRNNFTDKGFVMAADLWRLLRIDRKDKLLQRMLRDRLSALAEKGFLQEQSLPGQNGRRYRTRNFFELK